MLKEHITKKQLGKMEHIHILDKQWKNPLRWNLQRHRI